MFHLWALKMSHLEGGSRGVVRRSRGGRSGRRDIAGCAGVDDGRETQANIYRAVLNTMEDYPGVVNGLFLWDNWMAGDELWSGFWANARNFDIRDKPSGEVVRAAYRSYRR